MSTIFGIFHNLDYFEGNVMDSKFEEINNAYVKYQTEVNLAYIDCERFICKMVDGLAIYLNCERNDLVFGPTLSKFD